MSVGHEDYVLEMRAITKAFPGVLALDRVDLRVRPASVHVLVGENGAGKSTLMKVISGEYTVDAGELHFDGVRIEGQDTKAAIDLGIAMIHQELSPVLDMTIAENIFLGREPVLERSALTRSLGRVISFVDYARMYADTQALFDRLGLKYSPHLKMRELSIAGMQLIEIAKAISREAKLVIMDEPTSAISDTEVEMLFSQIADLKAGGVAIIYITHKMDEIFRIADDITVIRDGQYVDSGPAGQFDEARLISLMVGRTISNIFPKVEVERGDTVLEVRGLSRNGVFRNVSFSVRKGEILGLAGLVGAGRTEVARAIFGLDPVDSGEIILNGRALKPRSPREAIAAGVAMVSEDRRAEGLVLARSVLENISLANLIKFAPRLLINGGEEQRAAAAMSKLLKIKTPNLMADAGNLSGGNQQKVVLAKWLLGDLKVLILDEPTRGIDVGSKSEIHRLMGEFAAKGLAIIMISSELPEILGMSDRVVVMHEGVVTGEIDRDNASQENLMRLATATGAAR